MDTKSYKTISANKKTVKKNWMLIDAENEILGRLASRVAFILCGKHKPYFTPHVDCGDNVIVINAEKVKLTGNKLADKKYISYSGYPGGQKIRTIEDVLNKKPIQVVEHAVKGMLPKNRLGSAIYRNLHVLTGPDHPYEAQKPDKINLNSIK